MSDTTLTIGLVSIARPTFDVPLAQSIADGVADRLEAAGCTLTGSGRTLIMDTAALTAVQDALAAAPPDLLLLLQASFADSSMAVLLAEAAHARRVPVLLWAVPDAREGGRLRLNSLCGINLAGHALMLRGVPYDYLLAQPDAAGALSMAVGEYVSVSTQRDTERALIALETRELADDPEGELEELIGLYEAKGLSPGLSREAAEQLTAGNALAAHLDAELGIDPDDLTNPWHAGIASFFAFLAGAAIPLLAILLSPTGLRLAVTMAAVLVGTGLTGFISAHLGRAPKPPAIVRNLIGGALVMAITYTVGTMIGGAAG